ncbi:MAG: sigma-70 family RNA polymerase sigma factor [Dehalococcoidia bacterium]
MDEALKSSLERQAVEKCRAGDTGEFHVIVSLHSAAMFRTAYGITGDYSLAEDAVQDAFVRAWKRFKQFQPNTNLRNWLTRILVNRVIDLSRRKQLPTVDIAKAETKPSPVRGPEESLLSLDDRHRLDVALRTLSAEHRVVVVLRYYEQMTVPEIASATGWREGTVKSRLSRAMTTLRDTLGGAV